MPSFTYWRLYILAGGGNPAGGPGNALALAEWKFYDGLGVQIPTTGGTPSASNSGFGAAANAFDGNVNTFWAASVGAASYAPQWIQYQFASAVNPATFSLTCRNDSFYVQGPDAWQLQASNDGVTWTPMGNYSLNSAWISAAQVQTFTVDATRGTGPIWRLLISSDFSNVAAAAEIVLLDKANNPIATIGGQAMAYDDFTGYSGQQSAGPSSAFDGNINTYWASVTNPNTTPVWVQYRWSPGTLPPAYQYCVTTRNDPSYPQGPLATILQYSIDGGTTFLNVVSFTFAPWTSPGQTQCFPISEPEVACGSPPNGVVGTPYSHTFPSSGGTAPYSFAIISGALPPGLSLNSSTGTASGTPTTAGTYTFTIQITDANMLTNTVTCSITITGPTPVISCGSPPVGEVGVSYSHAFPVTSGTPPFTFLITSGSLPPGITLNSSTGVVSGTPTTAGTYPFTIEVIDANSLSSSAACSITINPGPSVACASPPAGTVGIAYTHTFPASGGTPPYTFAIVAGALPTGLSLNTSTGVVSGTPTTVGTFPFTIQVTDSLGSSSTANCSITINASTLAVFCNNPPNGTTSVPYTHTFIATGGTPPYTFTITAGSLPPGLVMDPSGFVHGTPTMAGTFTFTVTVTDAALSMASVVCSITIVQMFQLNCSNAPVGTVGIPYLFAIVIVGGVPPYTFSVIIGTLPPGLTLDPTTGVISGIPTQAGTYPFTVEATDSTMATVTCTITILVARQQTTVSCNNPPAGRVSFLYDHQFISTGTPPFTYAIIAGSLPPGLTMSPSGHVTGVPIIPGRFPFTLQVTDGFGQMATVQCEIVIVGPCPCSQLPIRGYDNPVGAHEEEPAQTIVPPVTISSCDGTLLGKIDGVNTLYSFGVALQRARVWRNGIYQTLGVDVLAGITTIQFNPRQTPQFGDIILVHGWPLP